MRLTDLFLETVARHGSRVAVEVPPGEGRPGRERVSYAELAAMADQVRRAVEEHVHGEALVVVLLPRETPWLYAAQLGVMWAGAGYVCLDETFPDAHIRHVVDDASAVCVVTDRSRRGRFEGSSAPVLTVGDSGERAGLIAGALASSPPWCDGRSLAYAIYTSGTTGKPKAVLIEHRGAVNLVKVWRRAILDERRRPYVAEQLAGLRLLDRGDLVGVRRWRDARGHGRRDGPLRPRPRRLAAARARHDLVSAADAAAHDGLPRSC